MKNINSLLRSSRVHIGWTMLAAALSLAGIVATSPTAVAAPPPGYHLVWSDEFNGAIGSAPDPTKWGLEVHPAGFVNEELESYDTNIVHAHIISDPSASDGRALQIEATSDGNGAYSSARLNSNGKENIQYGYIEARVKMPYGQGIWPAVWMLGSDYASDPWPACGEMDIMENIGNSQWYGTNVSSLHSPARNGGNSLNAKYYLPTGETFHDGYHLFQMLWKKGSISFYVDNHLFETRTYADLPGDPWPYDASFFFIMNLAVGGNFPGNPDATTTFPQNLDVDYVRVYQAK